MPPVPPALNGFEKHAQTAIQIILVAITVWVGSSIISLRDTTIRLEEKNTQLRDAFLDLKSELVAIRAAMASNAERDFQMNQSLRDLANRMERAEERLRLRPKGEGS